MKPFQTKQRNRPSCGDQEGRSGSDEVVPGTSVVPSSANSAGTLRSESETQRKPEVPPGKPMNTGVGSLSLLQGIFLTQESNQCLLPCRQFLSSWLRQQRICLQCGLSSECMHLPRQELCLGWDGS